MKILLLILFISILAACTPAPMPADGIDAATDATQVTDAGPEASSDALPPHVDGGGID